MLACSGGRSIIIPHPSFFCLRRPLEIVLPFHHLFFFLFPITLFLINFTFFAFFSVGVGASFSVAQSPAAAAAAVVVVVSLSIATGIASRSASSSRTQTSQKASGRFVLFLQIRLGPNHRRSLRRRLRPRLGTPPTDLPASVVSGPPTPHLERTSSGICQEASSCFHSRTPLRTPARPPGPFFCLCCESDSAWALWPPGSPESVAQSGLALRPYSTIALIPQARAPKRLWSPLSHPLPFGTCSLLVVVDHVGFDFIASLSSGTTLFVFRELVLTRAGSLVCVGLHASPSYDTHA